MELTIRNIGIVEEATVTLDGLTVIAGSNNSGKTTIGKALYAVADTMARLDEEYERDFKNAANNRIGDVFEQIDPFLTFLRVHSEYDFFSCNIFLKVLAVLREEKNISIVQYQELLQELYVSIKTDSLLGMIQEEYKKQKRSVFRTREKRIVDEWTSNKTDILTACKEALSFVCTLPPQNSYATVLLKRYLDSEFQKQIQPLHQTILGVDIESSIHLSEEMKSYDVKIRKEEIMINNSLFPKSTFESVFFFDDPYILDDLTEKVVHPSLKSHRDKLREYIREEQETGISEELYRARQLQPILEKVNEIVPGVLSGTTYLEKSGIKLRPGNLATGSKVFSILKKILENGDLTEKTLLILDEPESHLHPKWITRLAEVIVLLAKELKVRVLLTTHSPDFLLAVDAYMRKYQIQEHCHFYRTEQIPERFGVRYVEKTDDLHELYADYAASFAEMNALRKQYMDAEG